MKGALASIILASALMSAGSSVRRQRLAPNVEPNQNFKPKNLKLFNINGKEIWAINKKNAIRKASKLE